MNSCCSSIRLIYLLDDFGLEGVNSLDYLELDLYFVPTDTIDSFNLWELILAMILTLVLFYFSKVCGPVSCALKWGAEDNSSLESNIYCSRVKFVSCFEKRSPAVNECFNIYYFNYFSNNIF